MIRSHGHSNPPSRTYTSWYCMLGRCNNPHDYAYKWYGGRGITVCDRRLKFENFLEDMGIRPDGKTLDKTNNDTGYTKENCRWATRKEQDANRSARKP